jgi:hypothetical protein
VRQRHPDVERAQHGDIQEDVGKILAGHDLAINADDEDLLAESRYVLQDFPQIGQFHNSDLTFQFSDSLIFIRAERKCKMIKHLAAPSFDVASSLWLEIGAQRRHYKNRIKAIRPQRTGRKRGQ